MLRRRPDATFEFRLVEEALMRSAPRGLSAERREALRLRIMDRLGNQEVVRRWQSLPRAEVWVAIPAGAGVVAAILAAGRLSEAWQSRDEAAGGATYALATGDVLVGGEPASEARPGQDIVARGSTWLTLSDDVRIGLESGSTVRFDDEAGRVVLTMESGDVTVVGGGRGVEVHGVGWAASVRSGTAARFSSVRSGLVVVVAEGEVEATVNGRSYIVLPSNSPLYVPLGAVEDAPPGGDEPTRSELRPAAATEAPPVAEPEPARDPSPVEGPPAVPAETDAPPVPGLPDLPAETDAPDGAGSGGEGAAQSGGQSAVAPVGGSEGNKPVAIPPGQSGPPGDGKTPNPQANVPGSSSAAPVNPHANPAANPAHGGTGAHPTPAHAAASPPEHPAAESAGANDGDGGTHGSAPEKAHPDQPEGSKGHQKGH